MERCGGTGVVTRALWACGPGCTLLRCDADFPHTVEQNRPCPGCADCRDPDEERKGNQW